jgi:hypothetical protein
MLLALGGIVYIVNGTIPVPEEISETITSHRSIQTSTVDFEWWIRRERPIVFLQRLSTWQRVWRSLVGLGPELHLDLAPQERAAVEAQRSFQHGDVGNLNFGSVLGNFELLYLGRLDDLPGLKKLLNVFVRGGFIDASHAHRERTV